jgi:L-cysteate sulfo-lyase
MVTRSVSSGEFRRFGTYPTPLEPAPRLAKSLGLQPDNLWIKRDDLIGLGAGGNKVRKLEQIMSDALAEGVDTVVTSGAAQSNHARLTAAAAARVGMNAVLVLEGANLPAGNLLLDELLGARILWRDGVGLEGLGATVDEVAASLREQGRTVAVIPFGGSSTTGARGYCVAAGELLDQAPTTDVSVVALGSGGTMAGLCAVLGAERVLGVDCGAIPRPRDTVAALVEQLTGVKVAAADLRVREDQVGAGYGRFSDATFEAMQLAAQTEGLILDPTYTGRALAGLIASVDDGTIGRDQRVVFWHTGGLPGLFGHEEAIRRITG